MTMTETIAKRNKEVVGFRIDPLLLAVAMLALVAGYLGGVLTGRVSESPTSALSREDADRPGPALESLRWNATPSSTCLWRNKGWPARADGICYAEDEPN